MIFFPEIVQVGKTEEEERQETRREQADSPTNRTCVLVVR